MSNWQTGLTEALSVDLQDYISAHRRHGKFLARLGQRVANGHRLTVACPCGVTFRRWITPHEAAEELDVLASAR